MSSVCCKCPANGPICGAGGRGASSVIRWAGRRARLHRLAVGHPSRKAPGCSERIPGWLVPQGQCGESRRRHYHTRSHQVRRNRQMSESTAGNDVAGIDVAGIDVSKRALDVSVDEGKVRRFANTAVGVAELVGWLQSQGAALAVCEATGGYAGLVVDGLRQGGVPVHIAHPNQVGPLLGPVVIRPRPTVWTPGCCLAMGRSSNRHRPWPRRPTAASCRTCCADGSSWWDNGPRRRAGCPGCATQEPRTPYEGTSPGWTRRSGCWMSSTRNS